MLYKDDESFIEQTIEYVNAQLAEEKAAQVERLKPVPMIGTYEVGSLEEELAWEAMLDMIEEERDRGDYDA